jgi:hypothetical protein
LEAEGGQFFEVLADDKVVTRGFIRRKVSDYCLYLGSFEAVDGVRVGKEFPVVM